MSRVIAWCLVHWTPSHWAQVRCDVRCEPDTHATQEYMRCTQLLALMPVELCLSLTADSTKSGLQVLYTGEATHVMKSQSHLATSVHVQYALIIEVYSIVSSYASGAMSELDRGFY